MTAFLCLWIAFILLWLPSHSLVMSCLVCVFFPAHNHFTSSPLIVHLLFLSLYLLLVHPKQESVSIPEDVLKRVLHSLACGKFKVLKRIPQATGGAAADSGTC